MPLITDGDVTLGFLGRRRFLASILLERNWDRIVEKRPELIPPIVRKYAGQVAKTSGLDIKTVLKSKPVKSYWKKWDRMRWP